MLKTIALFVAVTAAAFAEGSDKEQAQIWNLEKAYWESVCGILATVGSSSGSSATSRTQMHGMAIYPASIRQLQERSGSSDGAQHAGQLYRHAN